MAYDYRQSHTMPGKAESYDSGFRDNPYRSLVWQLEQRCLDRILARYLGNRPIQHLDFACGTGRIIGYLADRTDISVGVDLAANMLSMARERIPSAEFIEADITRGDALGGRKFNLITAFRFFPNSQAELRTSAIEALVRHLSDDGYLVLNNHLNRASLLYKGLRLLKREGSHGMWLREVRELTASAGLSIAKVYPMSLVPATEKRLLLPRPVLSALERVFCYSPICKSLFQDLVFVCRHGRSTNGGQNSAEAGQ